MLHGEHRQLDADHPANLACPQAGGVDDMFGVDVALVGDDVPGAVGPLLQILHHREAVDFSAGLAGSDGVGVRHAVGIDVTAIVAMQRANEAALIDQRVQFLGFGRRNQARRHPEIFRSGVHQPQVVEDLIVGGEHQIAGLMDAAGLARDPLDLAIEIDRILLQLRDVGIRVVCVNTGCRMPRRARSQLVLLEQHHIAPAGLGQMVEDARTDHAAADHHRSRMRLHLCEFPVLGRPS